MYVGGFAFADDRKEVAERLPLLLVEGLPERFDVAVLHAIHVEFDHLGSVAFRSAVTP